MSNVITFGLENVLLGSLVVIPKLFLNGNWIILLFLQLIYGLALISLKEWKELHFKILHNYYPCNSLLSKFNFDISSHCTFCNSNLETIPHLFFECDYAKEFWKKVAWLIFSAYYKLFTFKVVNVLFLIWDTGSKVDGWMTD